MTASDLGERIAMQEVELRHLREAVAELRRELRESVEHADAERKAMRGELAQLAAVWRDARTGWKTVMMIGSVVSGVAGAAVASTAWFGKLAGWWPLR